MALAVAALIGGLLFVRLRGPAVPATAAQRADVVQTVLVSGRVSPPAEIELSALVSAPVVELGADEGDVVERGAILARLDATEAEAEVARARAALARAQAASGRSQRIAPQVAQQSLSTAQARLAESRRTLEQAERLVASGAWPEERLSAARDSVTQAQSAERSAELELAAARGADRQVAAATVDEALAALALAEERLAHCTIAAPVSGLVLDRSVAVGDVARPGVTLFRLAADGPPILSADPDERHLSQLALGQRADVLSDAFAERPFEARVSFIAPAVDPGRGTVEVRLLPTEEVDFLRPNMTVSVEIEVARAAGALVVPSRLVLDAATSHPAVWTARDGRLVRRPVTLGLRGDEQIEVTEGLEEGELVLEVVSASLAAGDRVRVEP
ncbi:MAG: efflux RND transporter periplasmic adaptor subunit [Sandaracinaceae bacterium]